MVSEAIFCSDRSSRNANICVSICLALNLHYSILRIRALHFESYQSEPKILRLVLLSVSERRSDGTSLTDGVTVVIVTVEINV